MTQIEDDFVFTELGMFWDLYCMQNTYPNNQRLVESVHWSVGYNHLERHPSKVQPGGTGRDTHHNLMAHCTLGPGDDWQG